MSELVYSKGKIIYYDEDKKILSGLNYDCRLFDTDNYTADIFEKSWECSFSVTNLTKNIVIGKINNISLRMANGIIYYGNSSFGSFSGGMITVKLEPQFEDNTWVSAKITINGVEQTTTEYDYRYVSYFSIFFGWHGTENIIYNLTNFYLKINGSEFPLSFDYDFTEKISEIYVRKENFEKVGDPTVENDSGITSSSKNDYVYYTTPELTNGISYLRVNASFYLTSSSQAPDWFCVLRIVGWLEVYVSNRQNKKFKVITFNGTERKETEYTSTNTSFIIANFELTWNGTALYYYCTGMPDSVSQLVEQYVPPTHLSKVFFQAGYLDSEEKSDLVEISPALNVNRTYIFKPSIKAPISKVYKGSRLIYGTATTPSA